jgi:ParB family chromosome partitioning protein
MNSRRDQLKALFGTRSGPAEPTRPAADAAAHLPADGPAPDLPRGEPPSRPAAGAVGAMRRELMQISEAAAEAARLRAIIADGETVTRLDPGLVDASFARDRFAASGGEGGAETPDDADFLAFLEEIRRHGQQAPALVRPHPEVPGRFQLAYGHRRWRAAARLGRPLLALVRPLSDADLVIAQGQENAARRDLSFIEKAHFAEELAARGFPRATLIAALAVQTAEVSRLLAVARAVPRAIAEAIGPAPKAGRPRWIAFAEAMKTPAARERVRAALQRPDLARLDSDRRFALAHAAALKPARPAARPQTFADPQGRIVARIARRPGSLTLAFDDRRAPDFGAFVAARLPNLYADWQAAAGGGGRVTPAKEDNPIIPLPSGEE